MIWLQEIPRESTASGVPEGPYIYVLYKDDQLPAWQRFDDTWTSEQPETDPAIVPPQGLRQPVRGFGELWRNNTEVRERLGWALEPERGFDGAHQIDWEPAYETDGAYLRTVDGRVLALSERVLEDLAGAPPGADAFGTHLALRWDAGRGPGRGFLQAV